MKRLYVLLITILSVVLFIPTTSALNNFIGDDTVNLHEDYNDNTFVAGNVVNVDSYVNGLSFIAGNSVTVKGTADYSFIAGNSVTVDNIKVKDLFVAGSTVTIANSDVRTIYAAAANIVIKNNATTLYVGGDTVQLDGEYGNAFVEAKKLIINGKITGTLTVPEDTTIEFANGEESVGKIEKYKNKANVKEVAPIGFAGLFIANIMAKIISFIGHLVIGFILILLFKKTVKNIEKMDNKFGFAAARFGIGLCGIILLPIFLIVLLFTAILAPLTFIGFALWGIFLYLASMVATLYLSKIIFANMNNYLRYALTLLILSVIGLIPFVGGLVGFITVCLGYGIILNIIKTEIKGK